MYTVHCTGTILSTLYIVQVQSYLVSPNIIKSIVLDKQLGTPQKEMGPKTVTVVQRPWPCLKINSQSLEDTQVG